MWYNYCGSDIIMLFGHIKFTSWCNIPEMGKIISSFDGRDDGSPNIIGIWLFASCCCCCCWFFNFFNLAKSIVYRNKLSPDSLREV